MRVTLWFLLVVAFILSSCQTLSSVFQNKNVSTPENSVNVEEKRHVGFDFSNSEVKILFDEFKLLIRLDNYRLDEILEDALAPMLDGAVKQLSSINQSQSTSLYDQIQRKTDDLMGLIQQKFKTC